MISENDPKWIKNMKKDANGNTKKTPDEPEQDQNRAVMLLEDSRNILSLRVTRRASQKRA